MNATGEPEGLIDAFWRYERALMADDVAELDAIFAPGPQTVRADATGVLVGHDEIAAFRARRGGAPRRTVLRVETRVVDEDCAWVLAETALAAGGRGLQSQLWRRTDGHWHVHAAHVSGPPPAFDARTWRVVGDPLVRASGPGALSGERVAVKDLFAVAGQPIGAGNPAWLAQASAEPVHAEAVGRLLAAGAEVAGISRTDEFAYSLAGVNAHYGSPANPAAPGRLAGGSSSGSAAAVASGQASIGLGTDTGGSIRIPAAYTGLFGFRPSHGAVPMAGVMPLAPSFDTVGWLARDADTLRRVGRVLLTDAPPSAPARLVLPVALLDRASEEVRRAVRSAAEAWGAETVHWDLALLESWREVFVAHQAVEAWRSHGTWLAERMDTLGPDVRARFAAAAERADDGGAALALARERITDLVGDDVAVVPTAPTVAPRLGDDLAAVREANLNLTCLAGLGGLPTACVPTRIADSGLPCGVGLLAGRGRDHVLLDLAASLE
ncbi:MAG: DUF3225 domain-containing protein [Aeromicrobium sp.]|uniref:AtzH-like domain-containing protein n=1 Tax=Aeromicrobium sp. TaxID=1871063 RepID=UPI0039E219F9